MPARTSAGSVCLSSFYRLARPLCHPSLTRPTSSLQPTKDPFTCTHADTRALFRQHGYDPDGCLLYKIPWGDQDIYGHVNNVRYFKYYESSRVNYFDLLARQFEGFPKDFIGPQGIGPVLRQSAVDFKAQLQRNEIIAIGHKMSDIKGTSFLMDAMILLEGKQEVVSTAREVMVTYDFEQKCKIRIPDDLRDLLEQKKVLERQQMDR